MIAAVVSTIGAPFRLEWYTNHWLLLALLLQGIWLTYQIFADDDFSHDSLTLKPLPTSFCFVELGLIVGNAGVSLFLWAAAYRCCSTYQRGVRRVTVAPGDGGEEKGAGGTAGDGTPGKEHGGRAGQMDKDKKLAEYGEGSAAEEAIPLIRK